MASQFLKKAIRVATGIAAMLAAGAAVATPQAQAFDVYTSPGTHNINGRQWRTSCAKYSTTVERCTTDIYATQVAWNGARWVQSNGWVFNNLTYKPNPRSVWKGNPIATPGNHTVNGRRWYTECDTKWTGGNACRSMIEATVPERYGSSYRMVKKLVFNNIVHFTPAAPAAPTPKWYPVTDLKAVSTEGDATFSWDTGTATIGGTYFPDSALWWVEHGTYERTGAINYALNSRCTQFEATIGARSDSANTAKPILYRAYVNGEQVGDTITVEPFKSAKLNVDVRDAVQIKLWVHRPAGGAGRPAFGNPRVLCTSDPAEG